MWNYLDDIGINSHRAGIVKELAEKANTWISGLYDEDVFASGK